MPKTLSDKLGELEDEIKVLLTLQNAKSRCWNEALTKVRGSDNMKLGSFGCKSAQSQNILCNRAMSSPGFHSSRSNSCCVCGVDHVRRPNSSGGGAGYRGKAVCGCNCAPIQKLHPCLCEQKLDEADADKRKNSAVEDRKKGKSGDLKGSSRDGLKGSSRDGLKGSSRDGLIGSSRDGLKGNSRDGNKGSTNRKDSTLKNSDLKNSKGDRKSSSLKENERKLKSEEALILKNKEIEEKDMKLSGCNDTLTQLQSEMEKIRLKLNQTEQDKKAALNKTQEMKGKFEKLRNETTKENEQLSKLKQERDTLAAQLEKESEQRREVEENVKKAAKKDAKLMQDKLEKIELHAAKSAKKVKRHGDTLATAVVERDDHIRRLSGTTEKLADSIRDKDFEYRKLEDVQKGLILDLARSHDEKRKLADTNEALLKSVKDFQEKLNCEKSMVQKLQKLLWDCREESRRCSEELERSRVRLKEAMRGPKQLRDTLRLQAKLQEARERERKWLDEEAYLESKLNEVQQDNDNANKQADEERERMIADYKRLQAKFEELSKKFQRTIEDHETKIAGMENDFKNYSNEMKAKQDALLQQKQALQADFTALVEASQQDRKILQDMIVRTQKQDMVINSQQQAIASKDESISNAKATMAAMNEKQKELEGNISNLENTLQITNAAFEESSRDMETVKKQLMEARDEIVSKEIAIAEHVNKAETLKAAIEDRESQLQSVTDEIKQITDDHQQVLIQESQKKVVMPSALKTKVLVLEDKFNELCTCAGDGNEQQIITKLEKKAVLLLEESEIQMQLVVKQKDQALSTARFATQKLLETVCDFQSQTETHKQVQYMLIKMLREKEKELEKPSCGCKPTSARSSKRC